MCVYCLGEYSFDFQSIWLKEEKLFCDEWERIWSSIFTSTRETWASFARNWMAVVFPDPEFPYINKIEGCPAN